MDILVSTSISTYFTMSLLRGDLVYVLPCVILFLCFLVLLELRLPRLGKRELILVLFVRLFDLCLFGFVGFLFLLVSGKDCGLWLWHSLDFLLPIFLHITKTRLFKYIENFLTKKTESFQIKVLIFFKFQQNIDCRYSLEQPRRGGSNKYPQSMFFSENKRNNVYPCKPQFYYIKVAFKEVKMIYRVFVMHVFVFGVTG